MFNLGHLRAAKAGAHAYYHEVAPGIGAKIYRDEDHGQALLEYIVTAWVSRSGFTTEHLAFGTASSRVGRIPYGPHPTIWMKHIEGETLEALFRRYIRKWCPRSITDEEEQRKWAWEHAGFAGYRRQFEEKCARLERDFFITCDDHVDNLDNVMVEQNGNLRFIDFSYEAIELAENAELRERIYSEVKDALLLTEPSDDIKRQLKKAGIVYQ